MTEDAPGDRDLLAAEYVVGLLTPSEARQVEAWAIADPALASSISAWQERLSGLSQHATPVTPPASVWRRLEAEIMPPVRSERQHNGRWKSVAAWRGAASKAGLVFAGGVVGAAIVGAVLAPKLMTSQPAVAALTPVGTPMPAFLVMVRKDGTATIVATAAEVQPGNELQLWGLPEGATMPIRLSVLPTSGRLDMPAAMSAGTVLLVSSEPKGGPRLGGPTGPVVYKGRMVKG